MLFLYEYFEDSTKIYFTEAGSIVFLNIKISDTDLGNVVLKPSALVTNFGLNYQLNHKRKFLQQHEPTQIL